MKPHYNNRFWAILLIFTLFSIENTVSQTLFADSINTLITQSDTYLKADNFTEAVASGEKAWATAQTRDNKLLMAEAALQLGLAYYEDKKYQKAIELYNIALTIFENVKNAPRRARVIAELGRTYYKLKRPLDNASVYYLKALDIYNKEFTKEETEKYIGIKALIFDRTAVLLASKKQFDDAEHYALDAIKIYEQINDKDGLQIAATGLGNIYYWKEDFKKAKQYYQKAYDLCLEIPKNTGRALNNLAMIYHNDKEYEKALKTYMEAIEQHKKMNNAELIGQAYVNIGSTYVDTKQYERGIEYLEKAVKELNSVYANNGLPQAYEELVVLYTKTGDYAKALAYQKKLTLIKDSLNSQIIATKTANFKVHFETAEKENKIKLQDEKINKQYQNLNIMTGVVVVLCIFGFLLWQIVKQKQKVADERAKLEKQRFEATAEKALNEMKIDALRAQMNPHFIFNCLNTIEGFMLQKRTLEASTFLQKFSKLIRMVLENSRHSTVSLEQDIETVTLYIQLEKIRYEGKFEYVLNIDDNLVEYHLPPMLIQPFVENAILHGLRNRNTEGGILEVFIEDKNDLVSVTIQDNGIGYKKSQAIKSKNGGLNKTSIGIKITEERLKIFYPNTNLQIVDAFPNAEDGYVGTKITFQLPKIT